MLKAGSKRRMTKAECEEKKLQNKDKDLALSQKLSEIQELKQ
jgi:hypothetical protein